MRAAIAGLILFHCTLFGQESTPRFEIADVHVSPKPGLSRQFFRNTVRGWRWELRYATMLDLIRTAYGITAEKILGGPSWLEMDHFEVVAKIPRDTKPETQKDMLRALLAERFHLAVKQETRAMTAYFLQAGKKPLVKEADGSGEGGCKPESWTGPGATLRIGGGVLGLAGAANDPRGFALGPGGAIQYQCRNITMASFAENLRGVLGANLGTNPVTDETGLKGKYNFDLGYSALRVSTPGQDDSERVSLIQAVEKQLGLKLESRPTPTPVIVVESVNRMPSENPPGAAAALALHMPTEFDVAAAKIVDMDPRTYKWEIQPGGRVVIENYPVWSLLQQAFYGVSMDQLIGMPPTSGPRVVIVAKAEMDPAQPMLDNETLAPLLLKLLEQRFGLKYHMEERPVTAYVLAAAKPKLKRADPDSRSSCKSSPAPAGAPPGTTVLTCQNVTMEQFGNFLRGMASELTWPVADATGLEGTWDLTLTYSRTAGMAGRRGGSMDAGSPSSGSVVTAEDPTGGETIFHALEKQLGLKLEQQKRPIPVYVIDHIEQKPTEN
jgi:uncharacterized protein (TIGR03435 family)